MPPKEFSCKQCGNYCLNLSGAFTTCADEKEIERWEKKGRSDILKCAGKWRACFSISI